MTQILLDKDGTLGLDLERLIDGRCLITADGKPSK